MKKIAFLCLVATFLLGCSQQGGAVDVSAVQKQADKEKAINNKAMQDKPLPPGDGPAN
jgi:outer membrane lipoprotein-sorting protein